jgi:hypothetical protein
MIIIHYNSPQKSIIFYNLPHLFTANGKADWVASLTHLFAMIYAGSLTSLETYALCCIHIQPIVAVRAKDFISSPLDTLETASGGVILFSNDLNGASIKESRCVYRRTKPILCG